MVNMHKQAVISGLIIGIIGMVFTTVLYIIGTTAMVHWISGVLALVLFLSLYIFLGIRNRKMNGNVLPFKNAFVHIFIMSAVASVLSTIFTIILYQVIDPDLPQQINNAVLHNTESMMLSMGVSPDDVEIQLDNMQAEMKPVTVGTQLLGLIWQMVGSAIIALIVGAIIKKKAPKEQVY